MSWWVEKLWYGRHPLRQVLRPFSWIYQVATQLRRRYLQRFCQVSYPVPIIVVGNLTVGGVGKTPLVIALANKIKQRGLTVGIVSRGYGAKTKHFPYEVQLDDKASEVGDEPLLIAQKTKCPVAIAPRRSQAVEYLLSQYSPQVIISDDGLQHYRLGRSIEIAVIDGMRGLGNGLCLPAGPLRERAKRLKDVDFMVLNGSLDSPFFLQGAYLMDLQPGEPRHLATGEAIAPQTFAKDTIAISAIGNPQRFYATLRQIGIECRTYSYPDHYQFKENDLDYAASAVLMTEKDAVKCRSFVSDNMYYLPVEAVLNNLFWEALWSHQQLKRLL